MHVQLTGATLNLCPRLGFENEGAVHEADRERAQSIRWRRVSRVSRESLDKYTQLGWMLVPELARESLTRLPRLRRQATGGERGIASFGHVGVRFGPTYDRHLARRVAWISV